MALGGRQRIGERRATSRRSRRAAATAAKPIDEVEAAADEASKLKVRQLREHRRRDGDRGRPAAPAVYVVPDQDPNAFATGRGPGHASIAVTRGLLETLDREELQGVVAHEMSHIRNLDIRLMTVVAALVGAVALLADWARRGMMWGGGRAAETTIGRGGGAAGIVFFVVWIVAILLAPLVARMLAMMVSRRREYLADATGAELTRNPLGLARALEKIEDAGDADARDQARIGAPLHRRSARPADQSQDGILVGHLRVASTDGRAHRRAEGDGVSGRRTAMSHSRIGMISVGMATLGMVWLSAQTPRPDADRIRGFSAASSAAELERERELKAIAVRESGRGRLRHHDRGAASHRVAVRDQARRLRRRRSSSRSASRPTKYEYSVLLPWPGQRRIDIVAPDQVKLEVEEEKIRGDQWADKPGILPAYNAYSPSGDVTGEIVYVNFGIPADYETLEKLGIDVKGKIVLARYGGSWRGIKPKVAAEHGAIACIIYSDPHEDGYFQGDVYPDGPFRGWGMIQRGSVMDMPRYPGDPSTPGRPSKAGVERLPMDKIETFAPIPVQPMSYRDGVELLKRLKGPVAPEAWRGSLPMTYHIGPGPAKVHMKLQMDYAQRRLINVVGQNRRRGRAGRMDHRRLASRRVDVRRVGFGQRSRVDDGGRARDGRDDEEGMEAAPQRPVRQLGRRGTGAARIDRVGRGSARPS